MLKPLRDSLLAGLMIFGLVLPMVSAFASDALDQALANGGICVASDISTDGRTVALNVQSEIAIMQVKIPPDGFSVPAMWQDGVLTGLPLGSYRMAAVAALTRAGDKAIGAGRIAFNENRPVLWTDGVLHTLTDPTGGTAQATVVSTDGQVIGGYTYTDGRFQRLTWSLDGTASIEPSPQIPFGISHHGTVAVGNDIARNTQAFANIDGTIRRLLPDAWIAEARAVSDDGRRILVVYVEKTPRMVWGLALVEDGETRTLLPTQGLRLGSVSISGDGGVVIANWGVKAERGTFLWREETGWQMERLSDILSRRSGGVGNLQLGVVTGLSGDGSVMIGNRVGDQIRPWRLDLTPSGEPRIDFLCP